MQCFVVHPGEVTTAITRTLPAPLYRLYLAALPRLLLTPEQGAMRVRVRVGVRVRLMVKVKTDNTLYATEQNRSA